MTIIFPENIEFNDNICHYRKCWKSNECAEKSEQ